MSSLNSKYSIHNYQRTCPSVLQQLQSAPDLPGNIYKKFISENAISTVPPSLLPRNTRQVINLQHNEHQQSRLSHDALYNLHELSLDLSGFVKVIRTHPDLIVVCGLDLILEEMEMVLHTQSTNSQLLSYDTTFQLGDFYVSPFLFCYTPFKTSPVIPAAFLIHERKFQACHEELMLHLLKAVPALSQSTHSVPLVTDDEVGVHKVSSNCTYLFIYITLY